MLPTGRSWRSAGLLNKEPTDYADLKHDNGKDLIMKKSHLILAILFIVIFAILAVICIVKRQTVFIIPCIGLAAAGTAFLLGSKRKTEDF